MKAKGARSPTFYELVGPPVCDGGSRMYHGVDRSFASVGPDCWEDSPACNVFTDYCRASWQNQGEWDGFFPTLDAAQAFRGRFQKQGYSLGIAAVYLCESAEDAAGLEGLPGYRGLDVSNSEPQSMLRPEWLWDDARDRGVSDPLAPLWALPPLYFRTRINEYGLLGCYEDAALFRDVMRALEMVDTTGQTPKRMHVLGVQEIADEGQ